MQLMFCACQIYEKFKSRGEFLCNDITGNPKDNIHNVISNNNNSQYFKTVPETTAKSQDLAYGFRSVISLPISGSSLSRTSSGWLAIMHTAP